MEENNSSLLPKTINTNNPNNPLGESFGNELVGDLIKDIRLPTNMNTNTNSGTSGAASTPATPTPTPTPASIISEDVDVLAAWRDSASASVNNFLDAFYQTTTTTATTQQQPEKTMMNNDNKDYETEPKEELVLNAEELQHQQQQNEGVEASSNNYEIDDTTLETTTSSASPVLEWDVYICQSRQCKERGASATLDTFQSLAPQNVHIHPAIFSKSKAKGPNVRCIPRQPAVMLMDSANKNTPAATPTNINMNANMNINTNMEDTNLLPSAFEVNNVNGIDKVYRILTHHMNLPKEHVSAQARDCLKDTYEGNAQLEQNDYTAAIVSYTRALETNYKPQEGTVLLLRATAYLQRAFQHQQILRETVRDLSKVVPDPLVLGKVYQVAQAHPDLAQSLLDTVLTNSKAQAFQFRQMKYRHGLYEYALLHAAQDSLRSTHLLPYNAKSYLRAGDALAELRKLKEAIRYYEKAVELDPALEGRLVPVMERLMKSCEFLDRAKELGWSGDTLRLALDVAG